MLAGISRNFLWEIEAGRKAPALHTLYNLGVTLNVSIDYLMGATDEKTPIEKKAQLSQHDRTVSRLTHLLDEYGEKELELASDVLFSLTKYLNDRD